LRELVHGARLVLEPLRSVDADGEGGVLVVGSLPEPELEMSIEEEAGAILEGELAHDLSLLRRYYEQTHKE
jgi:hypothetical protein